MKKQIIPIDRSFPLFLLIAFFTGVMLWRCLSFFLPIVTIWRFGAVYLLCSLLLPTAYYLPHSIVRKWLDILGNYWLCFQLTFFFAALINLILKVILVYIFKTGVGVYPYCSLFIYIFTAATTFYGIVHARTIYYPEHYCNIGKKALPLHIVHLSDLHLGSLNDNKKIKKIVKRVNALSPDIVCITGDTFTENIHGVPNVDDIADTLKHIESRFGTYACLGNHDYGLEFEKMLTFFEQSNIRVLRDERIQLEGITLIGRIDLTPGGYKNKTRKSIAELIAGTHGGDIIIVLDHQPAEIQEISEAGVDLLLCGHTHGGQFFPVHRMVRRIFPHFYGCKRYGKMYAVVSSGACMAIPPIRIGSHSEVISIYLG